MFKYTVDNIQWDIDYYPDDNGDTVELPHTTGVYVPDHTEDHEEYISDYLSNTFGFCHRGFSYYRD